LELGGLPMGGRLLITTHLHQSNYLANQKRGTVNKYDLSKYFTSQVSTDGVVSPKEHWRVSGSDNGYLKATLRLSIESTVSVPEREKEECFFLGSLCWCGEGGAVCGIPCRTGRDRKCIWAAADHSCEPWLLHMSYASGADAYSPLLLPTYQFLSFPFIFCISLPFLLHTHTLNPKP
jgi:hypothetical protein